MNRMKIDLSPIGIIHSPYAEPAGVPIQGVYSPDSTGTVEVFPEFAEGLTDLEGFSHILLLYCFHRAQGYSLMCRPFLDDRDHGVFATRAPRRPNPLGLSLVELHKVEGAVLTIGKVDIVDGAPLLDIKPYVPDFDMRHEVRTGWIETAANRQQTIADGRFTEKKKD